MHTLLLLSFLFLTTSALHLHFSHPQTLLSLPPNIPFTTQNFSTITTPLPLPSTSSANSTSWSLHPVGSSLHLLGGTPGGSLQSWQLQETGWEPVPLSGGKARSEQASFSDERNTTYLFGGVTRGVYSSELQQISGDSGNVYRSDARAATGDKAWVRPSAGSTMTLLPGGRHALLLGGFAGGNALVGFSQVAVYSLDDGTWEFRRAVVGEGRKIESRGGHTAVLDGRGRVIVFGGRTVEDMPAEPRLVALDLKTWEWEVPEQGEVEGMFWGHAATMLPGEVMLAVGGDGVALFNAKVDRWVDEYRPPSLGYSVEGKKGFQLHVPALAAGIAVGGAAAIVMVVLGVLMCKAGRRRRMGTAGTTKENDGDSQEDIESKAGSPTPSASETQAPSNQSLSQHAKLSSEEDKEEEERNAPTSGAPTYSPSSTTLRPDLIDLERARSSPEQRREGGCEGEGLSISVISTARKVRV
ncbi:hypothetical protein K440DRAFT_662742 [Wilcoxina mikolae CBS 423.85]|nr:hypothetical protein K440DRAFT_662742 [Wilcoxina mikolae CBS 423.85]